MRSDERGQVGSGTKHGVIKGMLIALVGAALGVGLFIGGLGGLVIGHKLASAGQKNPDQRTKAEGPALKALSMTRAEFREKVKTFKNSSAFSGGREWNGVNMGRGDVFIEKGY